MYENHFSFKCKPFELIPNPDFLFLSESHKKAITYLDYGVKEKIGFILLTGEVGSGKTTIVRNLIKNLNGAVKLSKINNTKVSSEQLLSMINEDFGLQVKDKDKTILISELNEFLIEQYTKGLQPILLIDEAQNLNSDLLEEIRLLSNLETDRSKLLQIILVGQPELKRTLMLPNLLQLRQRINISYHIIPLSREETSQYIIHRLTIAGNPYVMRVQGDMLNEIYHFSRGIPRLINILCDFSLLATFVEEKKEVSVDVVKDIIKDLKKNNYWNEYKELTFDDVNNLSRTEPIGTINELMNETTNNLEVRINKIEDEVSQFIRNTSVDMNSILEQVRRLEENIMNLIEDRPDNRIAELFDRVLKLETMPVVANKDIAPDTLEIGEYKSMSEQIEFIKRMVNYINTKFKKI